MACDAAGRCIHPPADPDGLPAAVERLFARRAVCDHPPVARRVIHVTPRASMSSATWRVLSGDATSQRTPGSIISCGTWAPLKLLAIVAPPPDSVMYLQRTDKMGEDGPLSPLCKKASSGHSARFSRAMIVAGMAVAVYILRMQTAECSDVPLLHDISEDIDRQAQDHQHEDEGDGGMHNREPPHGRRGDVDIGGRIAHANRK